VSGFAETSGYGSADRVAVLLKALLRAGVFAAWLVAPGVALAADEDLARWVDPLIGTDGTGHVLPGATRPFGMVAPSPDNASGGWDFTAGYQYRAP
jgi:putative alpha-1,2-mannosidase